MPVYYHVNFPPPLVCLLLLQTLYLHFLIDRIVLVHLYIYQLYILLFSFSSHIILTYSFVAKKLSQKVVLFLLFFLHIINSSIILTSLILYLLLLGLLQVPQAKTHIIFSSFSIWPSTIAWFLLLFWLSNIVSMLWIVFRVWIEAFTSNCKMC